MGQMYDIIQRHIDAQPYGVSERKIAAEIGVTQTAMTNWRHPKRLIHRDHIQAIARVTRAPYTRVLDALLHDIGYLPEPPAGVVREQLDRMVRTQRDREDKAERSSRKKA